MDELARARYMLNATVRAELEARPIFDPSSLDSPPHPPPIVVPYEEDEHVDDRGIVCGRLGPRMPWEVIP